MAHGSVQRRLTTVLVADVVAYSRLMERDQVGTIDRLTSFRLEVFEPGVSEHDGRIFKLTGDGALVEYASAVAAVRSAVQIQRAAAEWNHQRFDEEPIELRIGISLGDVFVDQGDLMGNAVNIAARLEALAEPGGICLSGNVQEHIKNDVEFKLVDLGKCNAKNITEPVKLYQVSLEDRRSDPPTVTFDRPIISFCRTPDDVKLAYTIIGHGPPVVYVANWLTHLEFDWQIATRRRVVETLAKSHQVIRYDARGNGLSDWDVEDISFEASVADLATIMSNIGLDKFALVGSSQGAAVAAAYAARHPEKVTRLVLYGSYARGRRMRGSEAALAESEAFVSLIREGWGKPLDACARMFGAFFMPDADASQLDGFTKLQRQSSSAENVARIHLALDSIDISDELPRIKAPTLVAHVRGDARAPFEEGRRVAAAIPEARFVPLEGRNHALLNGEPAMERFLEELEQFLRS